MWVINVLESPVFCIGYTDVRCEDIINPIVKLRIYDSAMQQIHNKTIGTIYSISPS
jgi:hypothetical protein